MPSRYSSGRRNNGNYDFTTDSTSSITFLGKRITREYRSAFVLPDEKVVTVTRKETFLPEEASVDVIVSISLAGPEELLSKPLPVVLKQEKIIDHLKQDPWAKAMLSSEESKDAELLGRIGAEYNSSPDRFRVERSEKKRRREEIVTLKDRWSDEDSMGNTGLEHNWTLTSDTGHRKNYYLSPDSINRANKGDSGISEDLRTRNDWTSSFGSYQTSEEAKRLYHRTPAVAPVLQRRGRVTHSHSLDRSYMDARSRAYKTRMEDMDQVQPGMDMRRSFEELRRQWSDRAARRGVFADYDVPFPDGLSGQLRKRVSTVPALPTDGSAACEWA
ncbi:unnamed protein product, partial [Protopolystoma xenopodis]